jgi:hypothetical protein
MIYSAAEVRRWPDLGIYTYVLLAAPKARGVTRRVSSQPSFSFDWPHDFSRDTALSLGLLPDPLCQCTGSVLCVFPHLPPVGGVYCADRLLQTPVPPILGHLHQADRDNSGRGFRLGLLWLVEFAEDEPLLP